MTETSKGNNMIHYLGPTVGAVPLTTWEYLLAAAHGAFEETQWVELKEMLAPGKPGNTELAKDLASLSVHGGVLVIGVKDKTCEVVGCDVAGYTTRISQVAMTKVFPPLSPVIYPAVPHPDDDSKAVLVVEVPPSPTAPHMVDGKYWGRSSDGKRPLSDPEVRLLMRTRDTSDSSFRERLLAMVEDDPVDQRVVDAPTGNGHVYLLAEPCAPVTGRAQDFDLVPAVWNGPGVSDPTRDTLGSLLDRAPDPRGPAMAYPAAPEPKMERHNEDQVAHLLLLDEDSSLQFVSGGGTFFRLRGAHRDDPMEVVGTYVIVSAVREFLDLVKALSLDHWGYSGPWRVGLHVTGLQGKAVLFNDVMHRDVFFPRETVTSHFLTTPASWDEGVDPVAHQLLTGFLRAIGCQKRDLDQLMRM